MCYMRAYIFYLSHGTDCMGQRLRKLKLESLELRRLRTDLLFAYKLVFGTLHVNVADFL